MYIKYTTKSIEKLELFIALSDASDIAARKAASGILATLSNDLQICEKILSSKRGLDILVDLVKGADLDLQHRGIECLKNICGFEECGRKLVKDGRVVDAFKGILMGSDREGPIFATAVEALGKMKKFGLI